VYGCGCFISKVERNPVSRNYESLLPTTIYCPKCSMFCNISLKKFDMSKVILCVIISSRQPELVSVIDYIQLSSFEWMLLTVLIHILLSAYVVLMLTVVHLLYYSEALKSSLASTFFSFLLVQ
jgi:hypothetical protein